MNEFNQLRAMENSRTSLKLLNAILAEQKVLKEHLIALKKKIDVVHIQIKRTK